MATYIYDDSTMNAVIDACKTIDGLTSSTNDAVQSALRVISTIASAGGDLGAEVGGTVLGNIRATSNSVGSAWEQVKKACSAFESARQILTKAGGSVGSSSGSASVIDTLAGMSKEEFGNLFVDVTDFIGDTVGGFIEDPAAKTVLGNVGGIAEAIVGGSHIQDRLIDAYSDRFSNGEISIGEYFTAGTAAATTNAVITIADGALNAIGLDIIPDHWNEALSQGAGKVTESIYRYVSSGIKTLWN